jgi:hypothetical protein
VGKVGYHLTKLGIKLQDFQDFILIRLDLMKNMNSNESTPQENPKLGMKVP